MSALIGFVGSSGGGGGGSLTVTATPLAAYGARAVDAAVNVNCEQITASATGGTPPYSYLWTEVGSTPESWAIEFPNAAVTRFSCDSVGPGDVFAAAFKCTATDATGATGDTPSVNVNVQNYGGISGGFGYA